MMDCQYNVSLMQFSSLSKQSRFFFPLIVLSNKSSANVIPWLYYINIILGTQSKGWWSSAAMYSVSVLLHLIQQWKGTNMWPQMLFYWWVVFSVGREGGAAMSVSGTAVLLELLNTLKSLLGHKQPTNQQPGSESDTDNEPEYASMRCHLKIW